MYRGEEKVPSFLMFKARDPIQWLLDDNRWKILPLIPVVTVLTILECIGDSAADINRWIIRKHDTKS